jgi:hypothetical protein
MIEDPCHSVWVSARIMERKGTDIDRARGFASCGRGDPSRAPLGGRQRRSTRRGHATRGGPTRLDDEATGSLPGLASGSPTRTCRPTPRVHIRDHQRRKNRGISAAGPPRQPRCPRNRHVARERGRGIGTATLRKILDKAAGAGARAVIAETTANNPAALAALRHNDARLTTHQDSTHVHARLALDGTQPPPPASPKP